MHGGRVDTASPSEWPERATPLPLDADLDHLDDRFTANASVFMPTPIQDDDGSGDDGEHTGSESEEELGAWGRGGGTLEPEGRVGFDCPLRVKGVFKLPWGAE
jgi:hypothetical protein